MGKHKPTYERTLKNYDPVVAINVKYLEFSGRRMFDKVLIYHTGYPGGLKRRSYEWYMKKQDGWEHPFRKAIEKMLQGSRDQAKDLLERKLFLYPAEEHDFRKHLEPVPNIGTTAKMGLGGAPTDDEMEDLWVRTMSMLPPEVVTRAIEEARAMTAKSPEDDDRIIQNLITTFKGSKLGNDLHKLKNQRREPAGGFIPIKPLTVE
ncbi:hypothetical protein NDN08_005872 [Rhodosorus marinus]|uniref:Uncharacterized protein n=1 Tax=Rhodosorus marinus TaxID=101924 RepID=A0AAV8V375_9RHOD|nr:hypothetical protein NDN08_005872 [Rhodosorus marinus]